MQAMSSSSGIPNAKVFFALWPSAPERELLVDWQKPLQLLYGGRAMRGATLHTTLVFIGDVEHSRLEALNLAALEAGAPCFELCFDAARYWGHNHIVYAAPGESPQQLVQLAGGLEQSLTRHGFSFDKREYQPHVTLLRNAHWTDSPLPGMHPACWQIRDFVLVQSAQRDGQADYRLLARFPLG